MNVQVRIAIATALSICLALPAGSHAAAPRAFYGVIAANDPGMTDLARMSAGGVGTLRINLVWGVVQSGPGANLDWTYYDELIGNAARAGIRVLPTVYSSPPWSAIPEYYPPSRRTWPAYAAFVRGASARYGHRGTFWAEHPDVPRMPIRDWQFWNEPNLRGFWTLGESAKSYARVLRVFSHAVRSGDRAAHVLLAGLFPNPNDKTVIGTPLRRYLPTIYRQKGSKALFDGVAIHPYARTPHRVLAWVSRIRRIMLRFKDPKTPIWLTEIGWSTGGDPSPLTVSPERQAAYLSRTFKLLAAKRVLYRIAGGVWFSWRDVSGRAWFNHTGLFTEDLVPKPAWYAFAGVAGGSP
jgi:hypothetical protein